MEAPRTLRAPLNPLPLVISVELLSVQVDDQKESGTGTQPIVRLVEDGLVHLQRWEFVEQLRDHLSKDRVASRIVRSFSYKLAYESKMGLCKSDAIKGTHRHPSKARTLASSHGCEKRERLSSRQASR